uniref:Uncharacterized protein n=1 Tax=Arundo donax TaxID=35708 RepID=A0A0A8YC65_ARUDO
MTPGRSPARSTRPASPPRPSAPSAGAVASRWPSTGGSTPLPSPRSSRGRTSWM